MFRRRRKADDELATDSAEAAQDVTDDVVDDEVDADAVDVDGAAAPARPAAAREDGPFDSADRDDDVERVDFGSLRVPVPAGTEIRVEVEEETGAVQSINVVTEGSALQLGVYAAPRKAGIWDEVRTSIAAGITSSGGTAGEHEGALGTELHAKVPVDDGKRKGLQAARFLGVDGPRWFVRGVLTGAAAEDDAAASVLVDVISGCVVVRGSEARAPHEALPLNLPVDARHETEELDDEDDADGEDGAGTGSDPGSASDLNPFERGPEITETR